MTDCTCGSDIANELEKARKQVYELREYRLHTGFGEGCKCDPPGSGEEWCTGTCYLRAENERLRAAIGSWRKDAEALWGLLDDIDTASDIAKGNLGKYQLLVEAIHPSRFEIASSDGYNLMWHNDPYRAFDASPEQEGQ